jgi:hypothetical protein
LKKVNAVMSKRAAAAPLRFLASRLACVALAAGFVIAVTKTARAEAPRGTPVQYGPRRATAERPAGAERRAAESDEGLFGPVRIGALAGVGFPRPLSIEGMVKVDDVLAFGVEYGVLPTLSVSDVNVRFNAIAADLRVFPLQNGFFVGLAAGKQHLGADTIVNLPQGLGALPEQVTADTWFINPRIGFLSTWSWGLTLGIDAGVQIPVSASFTNTIPSQLSASQTANDVAHAFGKSVLPTVDLLKIGLLF